MDGKQRTESIITKCIDGIMPAMRSTIIGYYFNNLSIKDLAKALNMKPSAVYSLVEEGREIIKTAVLSHYGEEAPIQNNRYLYTEIFLSCGEEAVETGGIVSDYINKKRGDQA